MANRYFSGFSTVNSSKTRQRTFYDLELCKIDLMNHFMTRPNERVMRPEWGCGIWNYIMEPLTEGTREIIADLAANVVKADSRCEIIQINIIDQPYGFTIEITINFVPQAVVDTFSVEFDKRDRLFFA